MHSATIKIKSVILSLYNITTQVNYCTMYFGRYLLAILKESAASLCRALNPEDSSIKFL